MNKVIILLLSIFLAITHTIGANNQYSFIGMSKTEGLVNNQATCFLKDSRGFLWIGTSAGLSRFDGSGFVNFKSNIDKHSLIDNYIIEINEDAEERLWIETKNGFVLYSLKNEIFITNVDSVLGMPGISQRILKIVIDNKKRLWIMLHSNQYYGLYKPDEKILINPFVSLENKNRTVIQLVKKKDAFFFLYNTGQIEAYSLKNYKLIFSSDTMAGAPSASLFCKDFFVDKENDIWLFGNNDGIYHYSVSAKAWNHYSTKSKTIKLSSDIVKNITQDNKGNLWIGTDHGGINIVDKVKNTVLVLKNQRDNKKSLAHNSVTALYRDNQGVIWIGTYKKGFCYYHENIHKFQHYQHVNSNFNSLPFNDINCFEEDDSGNLWIGTNGGGLLKYNRQTEKYIVFKNNDADTNSLSNNIVVSLFFDSQGVLWIGTYTGGLNSFNGKRFTRYQFKDGNKKSLPNNNVWSITEDNKEQLWIGTLGGGVALFNKPEQHFNLLVNTINSNLAIDYVNQIYPLNNGNMCIAGSNGIVFYNPNKASYSTHPNRISNLPFFITNKTVNRVCEDYRGILWIATREGLVAYNPNTDKVKHFNENDGLPLDDIKYVLEDEFHNLWISKTDGLSQIIVDIKTPGVDYNFTVFNYTKEDGLQDNEFNSSAGFFSSEHEILFGGPNGFNLFRSRNIIFDESYPQVIFTDVKVLNERIKPQMPFQNKVLLKESITTAKQMELNYSMNVFSIGFTALDFTMAKKVKYKYKLDGFDKKWKPANELVNEVSYTNLDWGTYILKVKASNNNNAWSDRFSELKIIINPPFYASFWAYVIYIILALTLFFLIRVRIQYKEQLKYKTNKDKELAKRNKELDEMKIRFLTNVGHEFRTPLTLILSPLEHLIKQSKNVADTKMLKIIKGNANQLLELVNQLLDFRTVDSNKLQYQPTYGDIILFIREICHNFSHSFHKKGINFTFQSAFNEYFLNFDDDKLKKSIINLLSNALKFTNKNGYVKIKIDIISNEAKSQYLNIVVEDNGIGIASNELDRIFDRFFQSEDIKDLGTTGNGIGLNITREMIHLHNGTIAVESCKNEGSKFTISLPVTDLPQMEEVFSENHSMDLPPANEPEIEEKADARIKIIIVEDNVDFREFMKVSLSNEFKIFEAEDGQVGLQLIHEILPDLIITDIMMPNLGGFALCKAIRNDIKTSHIPIIFLTAKISDADRIKGLKTGADDYITKPFNMELLLLRIKNLLERRSIIQQKFQHSIDLNPSEIEITSLDEKFIKTTIELIEKEISNEHLSVEFLSDKLGISRVHFYNKLMAIIGKSPTEVVRLIRLKRGFKLLKESQLNVSEVAYDVGFSNPRYFSKCFKQEFGILPTEFINKHRTDRAKFNFDIEDL